MSYADGELSEPTARAVREMAMRDPSIAGRIAMFKASRKVLSAAFDPVLDQPVRSACTTRYGLWDGTMAPCAVIRNAARQPWASRDCVDGGSRRWLHPSPAF